MAPDIRISDDQSSPCLNGGDPNLPVGLEPSPNGNRLNMGAFGGTAYASMSSNLAPTVTVSSRSGGTSSGREIRSVRVTAEDPDGEVIKVEFYVNGVRVAEDVDGSDNWRAEWFIDDQPSQILVVVAEDNSGMRGLSEPNDVTRLPGRR